MFSGYTFGHDNNDKNDNAVKPKIVYQPENNILIQGFVLHLWIILQPDGGGGSCSEICQVEQNTHISLWQN